jgi:hypothetical protein
MNSISKIPRRRKGDNYNGWKNHATWCVDFHLSNDQLLYNELRELVSKAMRAEATETWTKEEHIRFSLADDLKELVNGLCNEAIYGNDRHLSDPVKYMAWDLLSGYLEEVDWDEIASAWIEAEAGGEL